MAKEPMLPDDTELLDDAAPLAVGPDQKWTEQPAATLPLTGTEIASVVQAGENRQLTAANLANIAFQITRAGGSVVVSATGAVAIAVPAGQNITIGNAIVNSKGQSSWNANGPGADAGIDFYFMLNTTVGFANGFRVDDAWGQRLTIYRGGAANDRATECHGDWYFRGNVGFFGTQAISKPVGVPVTAAGIHAALVALGLIGA